MRKEARPRIAPDLAARIDRARGDVPFERWVTRALEATLSVGAASPRASRSSHAKRGIKPIPKGKA